MGGGGKREGAMKGKKERSGKQVIDKEDSSSCSTRYLSVDVVGIALLLVITDGEAQANT